ncbi:hypothetical protein CPB83DRAFT_319522 [Crepidotus variabilis]|uniref:Uncharacterized protein n=1 Tax=Crepidotus variabilis TaxID=179855 RepID=A0A9P6JV50_9AGAR|nr:hypothetical protein CPB83DRAFT_319522 [Crepidotus variabilis]
MEKLSVFAIVHGLGLSFLLILISLFNLCQTTTHSPMIYMTFLRSMKFAKSRITSVISLRKW